MERIRPNTATLIIPWLEVFIGLSGPEMRQWIGVTLSGCGIRDMTGKKLSSK
jgi:hypothetical protein